jgi:uncharacterized protein (TIGR03663 family)
MSRWLAIVLGLLVVGALALRLPQLDQRPLHNDEAVNAHIIRDLVEKGHYRYNADEYHGPTLHYFSLPFLRLAGGTSYTALTDASVRLCTAVFGALLVGLVWGLRAGLGRPACLVIALFLALSPAFVFYSRYFIHEILLVWFTMLALVGAWRYCLSPHWGWAALTGAALGLMSATKETFVINLFALAVALAAVLLSQPLPVSATLRQWWRPRHAAILFGAAALVWLLFFSSFFTNAAGLLDSVRTYLPWTKRARGASPHIHVWSYYLEHLGWFHPQRSPVWSESLILLLTLVGFVAAFWRRFLPPGVSFGLARFLAVYAVVMVAVYSAIPYKTPWCLLGFYHGFILVAGIGFAALWHRCRAWLLRLLLLTLFGAGLAHLGWETWRANFVWAADFRNPYTYSQTMPDVFRLSKLIHKIAESHPQRLAMPVKVAAPKDEYWPIPWYLRDFTTIGFWPQLPKDPLAPVMIYSANFRAALDDKTEKKWLMVGLFQLRPREFFEVYVEFQLWKRYVEALPAIREDD